MPQSHATLTGSDLHEPKGLSTAATDTVYHSDGDGTGTWEFTKFPIYLHLDDISTAGSAYITAPFDCTLQQIYTVIDGAIATSDAAITFEINGVTVTGAGITVTQSGSAAEDVDSSTPTSNNTASAGDVIEMITDGASTNTIKIAATIICLRTG